MRKDPLHLLEAAYTFHGEERAWLQGVVRAARPYDLGGGLGAYVTELGSRIRLRTMAADRLDFDIGDMWRSFARVSVAAVIRRMHAPSPARYSVDAAAQVASDTRLPDVVKELLELDSPRGWGVIGGDVDVETVVLYLQSPVRDALVPADRRVVDAVGAHLGACLRMRRALHGTVPGAEGTSTEAILSPAGKILHARGATAQRSLSALVEAVRRTERARLRRTPPDERLALWTALFEGRWSIVETVERDGKRMLLACKNEPETAAMRRLTSLERAVAQYAALGHPYKYVAYELGISLSGVAAHLQRALRKLGLRSRADLIRLLGGGAPLPGESAAQ